MAGGGYLVIMFFFGLAGGIVARIKGSSFTMWFLISAVVPFLGLLTAILDQQRASSCDVSVPAADGS